MKRCMDLLCSTPKPGGQTIKPLSHQRLNVFAASALPFAFIFCSISVSDFLIAGIFHGVLSARLTTKLVVSLFGHSKIDISTIDTHLDSGIV